MTARKDERPGSACGSGKPGGGKATSAARVWPLAARYIAAEERLAVAAERCGPATRAIYECLRFGIKQGWACLFGGAMLAAIVATHAFYPHDAPVARYDLLFAVALAIQVAMLGFGLETWEEARVIFAFHVIGTLMELNKTSVGSWTYPEASVFRIGGVPLFTGFMYAAVGSYLARVWRLFDFRFTHHPRIGACLLLSAAIYGNFLVDHYGFDARYALIAVTIGLFARTTVFFKIWRVPRTMPLLLGFVLVALFIWFAENIGTFTGTWLYPRQFAHWTMVPASKLTSWFLLMIVSYSLVARLAGVASPDGFVADGAAVLPQSSPS